LSPNNKKKVKIIPKHIVFYQLLRKNYPIFLAEAFIMFSVSGIMLTMVEISHIIFADSTFHALETSLIISARTWSMAFAGLFIGILADRFSRKYIFIVILIFSGFGRFLNGFAPSDAGDRYLFFILCNIIVGFGQGGLMPGVISYADDAMDPQLRSRFFGLYEIFRQSFQILGMILSTIMFQSGQWREYFWITGIILFICAILVFVVIQEPKRGAIQKELRQVLSDDKTFYNYHLNKTTIRKNVFSKTNIIVFIEGIFTWIVFSIALFIMYPYLQSPPYNISLVMSSIIMVIFGLPGAIIGSMAFSRISDKLAAKDIKYRINLIVFSIVILFFSIVSIFMIPLSPMTPKQGNDFFYLIKQIGFIVIGFLIFSIRGVLGIYHINQSPIIQKINLPEAQGSVMAWNQFLEAISMGLGPLIAGILLDWNNQNYLLTAVVTLLIGMPSAFLWLFARKWIHQDITQIESLLKVRAKELQQKNNN
jgi:MFS family permease